MFMVIAHSTVGDYTTEIEDYKDALHSARTMAEFIDFVDIVDKETGEVVYSSYIDDEDEDPDDYYDDDVDETGYNPYIGGYDFDC